MPPREQIKLWHDDVRPAPDGWRWAQTNIEAQEILETCDVVECSLDHDLGAPLGNIFVAGHSPEGTGYDLVRWMIENDAVPPKVTIHSWSYDGARRMARALEDAGHSPVVAPFEVPPPRDELDQVEWPCMDRPSQYQRYLQSKHWMETKTAFWNQVERACEVCGSEHQLEVHHCTYARIGREEWGDLVALCRRCHEAVHRIIENGQAELENAHLVLDGETPASPLRMRGRIRRNDVLQADSAKLPFAASRVPLFVEDGKTYTVSDLDHIATHMLWMQGIGEHHIFLTRAQWRNRLAPELFASGDVMAPDPSYTYDRHHNSIAGMYNRTHPEGRQWNSEEERKVSGRSFYRNTKVTEHRSVGKFVPSASPTITRNLTKPLSKLEIALMEAEDRREKKILQRG